MENREIKFRGLDTKGVWRYGDLIQSAIDGYAIRIEIEIPPSMSDPFGDIKVEYYIIKPKSVNMLA